MSDWRDWGDWVGCRLRDGTKTRTACIFFACFFKGQQRLTTSPTAFACLPACCLCLLPAVSSQAASSDSLPKKQSVVTTHGNTAHCIKSQFVAVQWSSLPLISFVVSVPGPVPVLILLCPVSTLSCVLSSSPPTQYHPHINRTLVLPATPTIRDPRSAIHTLPRVART